MLKEKDFVEKVLETTIESSAENVPAILWQTISSAATENAMPIIHEIKEVKLGGMFNSKIGTALDIYHPEHKKDYFHFVICLVDTAEQFDVKVYTMGQSKNQKKVISRQNNKANAKHACKYLFHEASNGLEVMSAVGPLVGMAIKGIWTSTAKSKLHAEEAYYAAVQEIIATVLEA